MDGTRAVVIAAAAAFSRAAAIALMGLLLVLAESTRESD
jgi:hypothetical protein